jgi:lupus La protein
MKIKEKGLTGKAASSRREYIASNRKGFNAFKEMDREKKAAAAGSSAEAKKAKPEIWLEFMGNKIRVHDEDGSGTVEKEEVPFVKGATMKFEGCGADLKFDQIKVRLSRFPQSISTNIILGPTARTIFSCTVYPIQPWR